MRSARSILLDIRSWIFLLFLVRLIGITEPPIEAAHNWRQSTVAKVARNFHEVDNNILYPRLDIAGDKTGITGMEFPLLNYLIYLVSLIFGYEHWYGRLINLIISSIGIFYFHRIVRRYFTERVAFPSTLILLCSIWFAYSWKIMPDTFAMSFILAGIYYGLRYLDQPEDPARNLVAYGMLIALGTLSKLPAGYLLVIFLIPLIGPLPSLRRKLVFAGATVIALVPALIWYFHWVPFLVERYGFWHFFMGKDLGAGAQEIAADLPGTLKRFYDSALKISGFLLFLFGTVQAFLKRDRIQLWTLATTLAVFLIVVIKAGTTFIHHSYYIIPFVPVMTLLAGHGISSIRNSRLAIVVLVVVCVDGLIGQQHRFKINEKDLFLKDLELLMDAHSDRDDLILINSGSIPTPMYFAHRKGWLASNEEIQNEEHIRDLQERGLKFIVIMKRSFGTAIELPYVVVMESEDLRIYDIQ